MSLNTLWLGYSARSTSVSTVYISRCPQPSHKAGGRISTSEGTANSALFSLPTARATLSGFNSPSCDNVPSRRPFTFYADAEATFQLFFYKRLSVFQYEYFVAGFYKLHQLFFGKRVLADFQYRKFAAFGIVLHKVVITDAASYDTEFFVGTVNVLVIR